MESRQKKLNRTKKKDKNIFEKGENNICLGWNEKWVKINSHIEYLNI